MLKRKATLEVDQLRVLVQRQHKLLQEHGIQADKLGNTPDLEEEQKQLEARKHELQVAEKRTAKWEKKRKRLKAKAQEQEEEIRKKQKASEYREEALAEELERFQKDKEDEIAE